MTSDIYVTFGGDTAALEASAAAAKAAIQSLQRDMASLARQMQATGASAESELGQKMLATAGKLVEARGGLAAIKDDMASLGAGAASGFGKIAPAAAEAAAGVEISTREMSHAVRIFAELAQGETGRASRGFTTMAIQLGAANPELIAIGAGALAAAGGLGYLIYQAIGAGDALKAIQSAAMVDQLDMSHDAAQKLGASIQSLAGVSASAAAEIARTFMAIGQGGPQIAEISSNYLPVLAEAMGVKAPEAAKKLAEMFADLSTKGRAYVADTAGVSAATIQSYDGYVAAGESGKAYSLIVDAMVARLDASRAAEVANAAATAASHIARGAALGSVEGLSGAERAETQVVSAAVEKYNAAIAALRDLQGQLNATTGAADAFSRAIDTALKLDKVGSEIAKTTGDIERMKTALATATASGDAVGAATLTAGIERATDSLKKLQQQASDGLLGRDLVAQTREQITAVDQTFKGSTVDRLTAERAMLAQLLAGDALSAAERHQVEVDLAAKDKEIRDASFRAYEAGEERLATAAALNKDRVIAIREDELRQAVAVYGAGSDQAIAAEQRIVKAKEDAAKQGAAAARAGAKDEIGATVEKVNADVQAIDKATADKLALYAKEAQAKQISEDQKVALTLAALKEGLAGEQAALQGELAIDGMSLKQKQALLNTENKLEQQYADAVVKIQEDAAAKVSEQWNSAMTTINGAFTSQISGLLRGTTSWRQAFKNVLASLTEDVLKFFVNWGLQQAETVVKNIVLGNVQVAAHVAGAGEMAAADSAAAATSGFAWLGNALRAIATDAAQVFGGVFAFLAPAMGPAAAGPAAASMAAVLAVPAADIGVWDVPRDQMTLIHQNELVMPAAEAGAFRGMLSGAARDGGGSGKSVSVNPTTHFHINANDSASVAQWVRSHGHEIAKGLDEAARHGAMLGLRRMGG